MLVLARKENESIMIGEDIEIMVINIKGDHIKLGIKAPRNIKVFRKEIYTEIQKENIEATNLNLDNIKNIKDYLGKK